MLNLVALTTVTAGRREWLSGTCDGYLDFKSSASERAHVPRRQDLRHMHRLHTMCACLSLGRPRNGALGRLQGGPNCFLSSHRGLCGLQALRDCLPHRLPQYSCLSRGRNESKHGLVLLNPAFIPISSARHRRVFLYVRNRCGDWFARCGPAPA